MAGGTEEVDGGVEHWTHGEYREVRPPERLVMTHVNDADGHEMRVEMDFAAEGSVPGWH